MHLEREVARIPLDPLETNTHEVIARLDHAIRDSKKHSKLEKELLEMVNEKETKELMNWFKETRTCRRCYALFTFWESMGTWNCRTHIGNFGTLDATDTFETWECCGSSPRNPNTRYYFHGCIPCDHSTEIDTKPLNPNSSIRINYVFFRAFVKDRLSAYHSPSFSLDRISSVDTLVSNYATYGVDAQEATREIIMNDGLMVEFEEPDDEDMDAIQANMLSALDEGDDPLVVKYFNPRTEYAAMVDLVNTNVWISRCGKAEDSLKKN
jgi:hypothetical protein